MIGSLRGKIILKKERFLIIESGGVGYKVFTTTQLLNDSVSLDQEILVWIYTHVREDQLDLYGFENYQELEFFELLLGVSSIGPKSALGILNIAPMDTMSRAIASADLAYLTKISGIGRKTAEKIILDLRDKIKVEFVDHNTQDDLDALEALKMLGYSQQEARLALQNTDRDWNTNQKIKEALKILSSK